MDVLERISALKAEMKALDDELDAEQSIELEAHLAQCAECRARAEREGQLRLVLRRAAQNVKAPASLRLRVFISGMVWATCMNVFFRGP